MTVLSSFLIPHPSSFPLPSSLFPVTMPSMHRTFAQYVFLLLVVLFCGCSKSERSPAASEKAEPAMAAPPPAATAAAPAATGAADNAPGGKKTGDKSVTTWKRSEIASNTSRLMVGDKEELPLRSMQI